MVFSSLFQLCPGVGDDTPHAPLPFYHVPDFIGSASHELPNATPIDLVFVDFIQAQMLQVLNSIQTSKNFTKSDISQYSPILINKILGLYAKQEWN
jgi:hypothetical protein